MKAAMILLNRIWPNNRINADWQFRCASLPAGYAERYAPISMRVSWPLCNRKHMPNITT